MVIKTDPLDRLILSTSEKYEQKKKVKIKMRDFNENYQISLQKELWTQKCFPVNSKHSKLVLKAKEKNWSCQEYL